MKFKKAVWLNIKDDALEKSYIERMVSLSDGRVLCDRKDPNLKDQLKDCDCLLVDFQVPVGKDLIDAAPNLKVINVLAADYSPIDVEEAAKRNIAVCNISGFGTESVAEFVLAAVLAEIRDVEEGFKRARSGEYYSFDGIRARELKNSKFGIIGLGKIGTRVAELASGFGANVAYWSRSPKDVVFEYNELSQLLSTCDYISINIASNKDTTGLLNEDNIPLIKKGCVLITTVAPEVVKTDALAKRLSDGEITFISDHAEVMPKDEIELLPKVRNCVLYPPIAWLSDEAKVARQELFVSNLTSFLDGNVQNKVN